MTKQMVKKLISAVLAVAMIVSLSGCSDLAAVGEAVSEAVNQAAEQSAAAEDTKAAGTEAAKPEGADMMQTQEVVIPEVEAVSADASAVKADHVIRLSSAENSDGTWTHKATLDDKEVKEYDYTWNCDYTKDHDEIKNAPAEYHTGTAPGEDAGTVFIDHDIFYFPEIPEDNFKLVNYDDRQEWAVYYPESSEYKNYIFGLLPTNANIFGGQGASQESGPQTQMMHSAKDALANAKLHITEAGSYLIEGTWHGQIWIDLGDQDDTFTDEKAKVTLYLNGADVTCTVAPALVFYSVYECDNTWEDRKTYSKDVDTTNAGARVVLVDGSVNNFEGCNVYRMLKTKLKNEEDTSEIPVQKKNRKTDAAFYSYCTMEIDGQETGSGILNIKSSFEGLSTELHLTLNGGNIHIYSNDDGVNVKEDDVSVVNFNGANVHILAGLGHEGDGVDSNGYLVVNSGTLISMANPISDSGLDSGCGSYVNGGSVVALGSIMDWVEADDSNTAKSVTMNLRFVNAQSADEAIIVTDMDGKVVFAYDPDKDETASGITRPYQGAVLSCENFKIGKEYKVYVGGDVTGDEIQGVYDVQTVTGFSENSVQQGYSGKDSSGFGFGGFGGQQPPEGMSMPEGMSLPEGMTPPEGFDPSKGEGRPEGSESGEKGTPPARPEQGGDSGKPGQGQGGNPPEGAGQGQGGNPPEGFDPKQGGNAPGMPGGQQETVAASELTTSFLMEDSVNNFAGVQDYLP